ncbi:MAG: ABC transporter permease [Bryobacteraceae bacterium]
MATAALLALVPVALLAVWSLAWGWRWPQLIPEEWSLRGWRYVASPGSDAAAASGTSLWIATAVAFLSVAIALPAGRALAWHEFRGKRAFLFLLLLPVLAPPLAAAMGVHSVFLRFGLTGHPLGVILVHLIPAVPYAALVLTGSFSRFDPDWEAQARTLGASPLQTWIRVTLPSIAPGAAVAAGFAFLISWSQYLFTLLIGEGSVLTLPLLLVAFQRGGDEAVAAALSLVFLAPAFAAFTLVAGFLRSS